MDRKFGFFIAGFGLGVGSWAIVPLVSGKFEPFDSSAGFYIGQALSSAVCFYAGFTRGFKSVLILLTGFYAAANVYAYLFGSTDARAMFVLGLLFNLLLCVYPLLFGLLGKVAAFARVRLKPRGASSLQ